MIISEKTNEKVSKCAKVAALINSLSAYKKSEMKRRVLSPNNCS